LTIAIEIAVLYAILAIFSGRIAHNKALDHYVDKHIEEEESYSKSHSYYTSSEIWNSYSELEKLEKAKAHVKKSAANVDIGALTYFAGMFWPIAIVVVCVRWVFVSEHPRLAAILPKSQTDKKIHTLKYEANEAKQLEEAKKILRDAGVPFE
jgi:hypothetical protein